MITDEHVSKALAAFNKAINEPVMLKCERCEGRGYHHGFGEDGHDPDWCEVCGGGQYVVAPGEEGRAMRLALEAAAISTVPSAGAGWKLVPVDPTPEMIGAWYRYKNGHHWPDEPTPRDTSDYGAYLAMLAAAPSPPASEVRVNPLEWRHFDSGDAYAGSIITTYFAHTDGTWCHRNGMRINAGETLEDAKSAAQADYERRILSAISTPEQGETEAVGRNVVGQPVVQITAEMPELRISLIARAVRQSLRNYGHKVAESTLPECIAGDVERTLVAHEKTWAKPPRDCGVNGGDLSESLDNIGSSYTRITPSPSPSEDHKEADRLRRMVERRDEFIIGNGLWDEFKEASHEAK